MKCQQEARIIRASAPGVGDMTRRCSFKEQSFFWWSRYEKGLPGSEHSGFAASFLQPWACKSSGLQQLPHLHRRCSKKKKKKKKKESSLVAQGVKDLASSLLWLWSLLWRGFYSWLGDFHMLQAWLEKKNACPRLNAQYDHWGGKKKYRECRGTFSKKRGFCSLKHIEGEIKLSTYILLSKFQVQ